METNNNTAAAPSVAADASTQNTLNPDPTADSLNNQEQKQVARPDSDSKEPIKLGKKAFKIKVDSQEENIDLDLDNEEELRKHLQLSRVAQKRMQEHSLLRKDVENLVEMMKKNPGKVLSDPRIGVDLKKFAQDIINQEIEDMQKTPEQREKEKLQKELEELREKYKKDEEERKSKEFERLQEETGRQLDDQITSVLEAGNLPKTPYTVRLMANLIEVGLKNDIDLSPKDLAPVMRKILMSEVKEMFSASPEDVMEELIGKDNISKIRKRNIQKVKQAVDTAKDVKSSAAPQKPKAAESQKKVTMKDFLKL